MKSDDRRPHARRRLAGVVLAVVLLALWGAATHGSLPSGSTEPAMDSVTPDSAAEGTVVTIVGENFGPSIGALQGTSGVSFNGVWASASSWSDTEIRVAVPPGSATGSVVVTVSGQASDGVEFTVTGTGGSGPAIGTVSPALGPEGTVVTVRGGTFGPLADMGRVSFNGVWATASSWSDTEIRVAVPADGMTGSVVVTFNGQASNGVAFIVTDPGSGEPSVDSLSSSSGPEGMVVMIEGENFGPSIGALQGTSGVSFNGVWASPTYWSETDIQVPVPAGAPSGLVTVAVGGEASNGVAFTVERPAPVIEAVDSVFGPEGTSVEITGENFGPAVEASQGRSGVSFNGVWGVPTSWSNTEIRVVVPAGVSSGLIAVTVGEQASNGSPFTVTGSETISRATLASSAGERTGPEISKLNPDTGQAGDSVKIKGSNFGALRGTSTVTFNGTAVTDYVSWDDTKIQLRVPEGATTGSVVVTVDGEASNGVAFTVTGPVPAINANGLSPDSGPVGTSVKVKGLNFGASQGESTVTFNGTSATPTSWSDTKIQVPVPVGVTTGPVVVTVNGQASNGVIFTVVTTPTIDEEGLNPDTGQVGDSVKIKGSNFGALRGTSTVTFNGTAVTDYVSWDDTKIQVRVPEGATTGPVVVTVDGEASSGVAFTVTGPVPAINANGLSPDSGPVGTSVKVKGLNFGASQGDSTVTFNGVAAEPTSWSDTKIQVPVPVGATTGPVVVAVNGQASNGVTFTVTAQPRLTLAADLSSVSEPLGTATLTVSVPGGSEPDADLAVTLSHTGTAGEGIDYSVGSLTILEGEASGTATLTVIDDAVYEGEERIALTAGATGYAASAELTITLEEDEPAPLTGRFVDLPATHGGYGTVSLRILFSEEVSTSTMTLRDSSFVVANGSVRNTRRVDGRSDLWEIEIAPSSDADLVVLLPATTDCAATGAVCTAGGKELSTRLEATIPWADPGPPVVSIMAVEERLTGPIGEFTVSRTGPTAEALEVQVLFENSRNPRVKTVTAPLGRGQSSVTRRVQGGDNNLVEDDITVTWTLQEGEGYTVSSEHPSASLVLEESDIPEFTVLVEPTEISEGGSATVTVAIANGVRFRQDQTIDLAVSGTASGSDYTGVPLTLKLDAWKTAAMLATLTATVDEEAESEETVTVTASHGGTAIGTATLTIAASEASP